MPVTRPFATCAADALATAAIAGDAVCQATSQKLSAIGVASICVQAGHITLETRANLEATLQAFLAAGIAYAEEAEEHCHQTTVGDFRLRYLAGEIASIART